MRRRISSATYWRRSGTVAIEPLLWFCLAQGTSIEEQGLKLSIRPNGDETILVFGTDCAEFRRSFYAPEADQLASDALFFYKRADKQPVLVFVELKGRNIDHALKQLRATILAVKRGVEAALGGATTCLALVVSDGATSKTRQNKQRDFETETGVPLRVKSTTRNKAAVDLRAVLKDVKAIAPFVGD